MPARITTGQRTRHFVREWRKHRAMTLDDLADAIDSSKGHLSTIETYKSNLTNEAAEAIAQALGTDAVTLRTRGPNGATDGEQELLQIYRGARPGQRRAILDSSRSIAIHTDEE